jgi:putative phosphoesterase
MKVLLISDIHANYPALQAVLNTDGDFDNLIFLGDVVDYGPHPKECLTFIIENADYYVRGNHDNAIGFDTDCKCMGSFREYSFATRKWHKTLLNEDDKKFLRNMPVIDKAHIGDDSLYLAHASPQGDIYKYINADEIDNEIKNIYAEFILLGHTHIQYKKRVDETLVVNPGSVGLARGSGQACYAVYENGLISLKQIDYDVEKTISDLMKSPIPQIVKDGLKKVLLNE